MKNDHAAELAAIRWRCRRGMLELDVILEQFVNQFYLKLDEEGKAAFKALLELPDPVLFDCVFLKSPLPASLPAAAQMLQTPVASQILKQIQELVG